MPQFVERDKIDFPKVDAGKIAKEFYGYIAPNFPGKK